MIRLSKCLVVAFVLCFILCPLSCTPSSTYLNETEFEEMRNKCLAAIPDSYSFRLDSPENFYFIIELDKGESSVEYYFYSDDTSANREDISNWIREQGDPRHINSNAILMDVKIIDDVFSYIKALYEDQLNNYKNSPCGRYLSTQIKYDEEYFFPKSFRCDILTTSNRFSMPEPTCVTVRDFLEET